jgi:hypothetical protein
MSLLVTIRDVFAEEPVGLRFLDGRVRYHDIGLSDSKVSFESTHLPATDFPEIRRRGEFE